MKMPPEIYEEMINLEALDRQLSADVSRFMLRGDWEGATFAELARRECQDRIYYLTMTS